MPHDYVNRPATRRPTAMRHLPGPATLRTIASLKSPLPPWIRFAAAALTGGLWGLSFPQPGIAGFAWAVPGMLLAVTAAVPRGLAFRIGYVAAAVHYLISLAWLRHIPFPAGAFAGWFSLSLFLALFPPLWTAVAWEAAVRLGIAGRHDSGFRELGDRFTAAPWVRLNLWFLVAAAAWVAWEMIVARLFGGFPWNLLGASQYRMLPLIQVAAFTGVYGVSFIIVWFSVSLFTAVVLLLRDPDRPGIWRRPLLFPAFMMVAVTAGGFVAILTEPIPPKRMSVALVQPAIPQMVIFNPAAATNRFETLLQLTEQALATRPDLVVWPEASLPGGISRDEYRRLVDTVRRAGSWLIFGADDVEPAPEGGGAARAFNSAFLMGPDGEIAGSYRKRQLVMFGEYIPLVRWFPFLQRLAPIGDGVAPGIAPAAFRVGPGPATASPLICFEDNFPHQARDHAPPGTDFLVNLTNDAWFGRSSAQWQHLANAVFRAVENGVPLIRATNNGISCWVDARGRVHSTRLATGTDVYEPGFDTLAVMYGAPGRTLYNRLGDVFGWTCLAIALLPLAWRRDPGPPASRSTPSLT